MVHILYSRASQTSTMYRYRIDLGLMFWIPMGLLSLLTFWIFPDTTTTIETDASDNNIMTSSDNNILASEGVVIDYMLVEDTTTTNADNTDNNLKVLRYAAQVKLDNGTYTPLSIMQWAKLLSNNTASTATTTNDDDDNDNNSKEEEGYIQQFINILVNAPMDAYFFETKGINYNNSHTESFEFVLVESSYLYQFADMHQDVDTFSEHFEQCKSSSSLQHEEEVFGCAFFNPRGDSILIAPMPSNDVPSSTKNVYGHLASFVRRGPSNQIIQFWKLVMQRYIDRLKSKEPNNVWLSTDGTGVSWLHVRLDPVPKYYDYVLFAQRGS